MGDAKELQVRADLEYDPKKHPGGSRPRPPKPVCERLLSCGLELTVMP